MLSCLALALDFEGRAIETVEGLASNGKLHPLQAAFADFGGTLTHNRRTPRWETSRSPTPLPGSGPVWPTRSNMPTIAAWSTSI